MTAYLALVAGYGVAAAMLLIAARLRSSLWPVGAQADAQTGLPLPRAILLLLAVIAIGQLHQARYLLDEQRSWRHLARALNQLMIFGPVFAYCVYAVAKGRGRDAMFAPTDRVLSRIGVGCVAAAVATVAYVLATPDSSPLLLIAARIFDAPNVAHALQILGEDLSIGLLLASLLRVVKPRTAVAATGGLFALGHIPAMIRDGARTREFLHLLADGVLAAGVIALVLRLRDMWVLWPVHVAMDLMQFYARR